MKFLVTVCAAAVAGALFRILIPEGKFSKQVSALIAGVFLLAGVTAFRGDLPDIEAAEIDGVQEATVSIADAANGFLREKVCAELSDNIYKMLNARGYFPEKVELSVNISDAGSIDITQVKLVFSSEDKAAAEAAAEYLKNELELNVCWTAGG